MWSFILSGISLCAMYLVAKQLRVGWLLASVGGLGWIIYFLVTKQAGAAFYSIVLEVIQVKAWFDLKKAPTRDA